MANDAAFYEVLEADLRALSSEARKTDSLATQIQGWLQHTDYAQIKECAERALLRLRAIAQEGKGVEAVRTQEILRPFLLVCESKNPKLIGAVLGSIQKLLAHNAVSDEGREQIIQALHQVEKSSDDTVKLKILQTALTLLQNPSNADDEEGAGHVLSLCIRIYCHNKSSPTVVSTAAATVRQAVALLFDHAVVTPGGSSSSSIGAEGVATRREVAAVLLLQDLLNMCAGSPPTWLKCPLVGRLFVLDLLEFVLLHRPTAFHAHSAFKALLQTKMGPTLADLSTAALDPEVEPASAGEVKLLLRCVGALLRKHALLLPDLALKMLETLLGGCGHNRLPWQRLLSLQTLRWLMADPQLLYALFSTYDMSIHYDVNAVHDTLQVALEIVKAYIKVGDWSEEDRIERLSNILKAKVDGKEQQIDVDSMANAPVQASTQEAWMAYLALDLLLAVVAGVETLADAVTNTEGSTAGQLELAPLSPSTGLEVGRKDSTSSGALLSLVRGSSLAISATLAAAAAAAAVSSPRTPVLSNLHPSSGSNSSLLSSSSALASEGSTARMRKTSSVSLGNVKAAQGNGASQQPGYPPLTPSTVSTLVDVLWRPLLSGLSSVLSRCYDGARHEALMLQVLQAYQRYTYSAGALGEVPARDAFLAALCEVAVTPVAAAEEAAMTAARVSSAEGTQPSRASIAASFASDDQQVSSPALSPPAPAATADIRPQHFPSGAGPALLNAGSINVLDLGVKNVHALRILFNCAFRLADSLGPSWVLVVEVLCTLDRVLPAATGPGAKHDDTTTRPSSVINELQILLAIANQLFENTSSMTTDAQVSLMLALSEVSNRTLTAGQQQGLQAGPAVNATGPLGASGGGLGPAATGASGGSGGAVKLSALNRMVEVLLYNLPRIQDLWGIFLSHLMEVMHSGNSAVRAAAIEALDKSLTCAIASPDLSEQQLQKDATSQQHGQQQINRSVTFIKQQQQQQQQPMVGGATGVVDSTSAAGSNTAGDVEHMLLVALESMYKEEREPDVRLGLLRVAMHVLQRHGEALSRGWVPLLRLLEAVPAWEEATTIAAAFQCVEAVSSDFLSTMPKQHLEKALDVVNNFAKQTSAINISLAAIGLLWNATDLLGRSRAAAVAAAAAAAATNQPPTPTLSLALNELFSILARRPSAEDVVAVEAANKTTDVPSRATSTAPDGSGPATAPSTDAGSYADPHVTGRSDLSEMECTDLLLKLFVLLRDISLESRPEVRNSGVRTLFLAVGSQASRFSPETLKYCLWEILFPLLSALHFKGDTSSSQEAAAVELGKEKGKAVMMLMHHSRNSAQKQWDETTVLAFNGLGKILKTNMATILALSGFDAKWDEICSIATKSICCGRKSLAVAAAQLLMGFLQSYKPVAGTAAAGGAAATAAGYGYPWKRSLAAVDQVIAAMAVTNTQIPLQARIELLTGLSSVFASQGQEGTFDVADMQLLLNWLDGLARHPTGADDVTPVPGVLPPVQKLVLQIFGHFNTVVVPDAWPDVLRTLAGFLCPFKAMQQAQAQEQAAAAAAAAAEDGDGASIAAAGGAATATAAAAANVGGSPRTGALGSGGFLRSFARLTSVRPGGAAALSTAAAPPADDAVMLTNQWMGKVVERLVGLYSHAPWQVRATLFGSVVGGLGECAALRHITPDDPLWQQAATGLVSVVNAGLPAVNIMFVNHHQPPENAWQVLASTYEMFLLGWGLPEGLKAQAAEAAAKQQQLWHQQQQRPLGNSEGSSSSRLRSNDGSSRQVSSSGTSAAAASADCKLQAAVLDSLTDVVLVSCSSAAHDLRQRLVHIVAAGAASNSGHACSNSTTCYYNDRVSRSGTPSPADMQPAAAALVTSIGRQSPAPEAGKAAAAVQGDSGGSSMSDQQRSLSPSPQPAAAQLPPPPVVPCLPANKRLSQLCLRKLALLAGRGSEGSAGSMNAVMLEVAQMALPLLLQQCRAVLDAYAAVEEAAQLEDEEHQPWSASQRQQQQEMTDMPQQQLQLQHCCLVDEITCVLEVVVGLQLDVAVLESVVEEQPQVAACLHVASYAHRHQQQQQHALRQQQDLPQHQASGALSHRSSQLLPSSAVSVALSTAASGIDAAMLPQRRQQGHLLLLYESLAQCVGCRDRAVGRLLRKALMAVGQQLFA